MRRRPLASSRLTLKVAARPSPKTVDSRAMVLALVVAGFSVVGAGQALTRHVGCGDTITTDMTLDSDLVNCPNNGILMATACGSTPAPRVRTVMSACSTGLARTG
jgi:hypothetical protein